MGGSLLCEESTGQCTCKQVSLAGVTCMLMESHACWCGHMHVDGITCMLVRSHAC